MYMFCSILIAIGQAFQLSQIDATDATSSPSVTSQQITKDHHCKEGGGAFAISDFIGGTCTTIASMGPFIYYVRTNFRISDPPTLYAQIMTSLWQHTFAYAWRLTPLPPFGEYVLNEWPLCVNVHLHCALKWQELLLLLYVNHQMNKHKINSHKILQVCDEKHTTFNRITQKHV